MEGWIDAPGWCMMQPSPRMRIRDAQIKAGLLFLCGSFALVSSVIAAPRVEFNRDIRPVLSDNCFACHGPDAKQVKGGLRLDLREVATKPGKSGAVAIVPGKPAESELVRRIFTTDADDQMPPSESHKILTTAQKDLFKRWIAEGAEYQGHWAYMPPQKIAVATNANPIDQLVQRRLKELRLKPAREADHRVLARRLHFDLVGLPPAPEEVAAFERDRSPDAYDRLVDRLMASPNYGERMAIGWLDVVRFADTIGYHSDVPRNIWPYRDYVIRSFNRNKPFDRFTREQLAGDLLPDPTMEQKVASGFNRLLLTTEEGGAQPKDYESRQLTDRVRAVGAVWLGQTIGCAQCHDHKFDPITARDFYSLGAFFADVSEAAIGKREPGMFVPDEAQAQELARNNQIVSSLQRGFDAPHPELAEAFATWERNQLAAMADEGKAIVPASTNDISAGDVAAPETAKSAKPPTKEIASLLKMPSEQRTAKQRENLLAHFKEQAPELADLRKALAAARKARDDFEATIPRTLITERSSEPRTVRILARGDWMDETGERVVPALPAFLAKPGAGVSGGPMNRLDLANWIVSRDNPLTARVVMNRLWQQFFGVGLSKVLDDLGAQGEVPPKQAVLDWLACEFMDSGWDMKHMVRLIVMSTTYRQTSIARRELLERDPENRLLARQSRWRLDAELVRDNALSLAGLLDPTIGGPSAKPYQPSGYWENLNFPTRTYEASTGASQYRRGLYTWWQRSFLHPSMLAFDAPSREECAAERSRSNIPQQALVLLNDPTYVEAAGAFAARILRESKGDDTARITWAWRQTLARTPVPKEIATLRELLEKHRRQYQQDRAAAESFLKVGQTVPPADLDAAELAAWTNVARALLNLHETITRA